MAVSPEKLSGIASAGDVPSDKIEALARSWNAHTLKAGEVLWRQGELANNLGLLYSGELQVIVDGQDIGTIRPGQVFGEATAFAANAQRSASLQAVFPSEVLLIEKRSLAWIRQEVPSFYDRLLNRALEAMAQRIRVTDHVITNLSSGPKRLPRHGIGDLQAVRRFMRRVTSHHKPPCEPLLESMPHLDNAPAEFIGQLASAFTAEPFERGQVITREGDEGNSVYLIGSGSVRAMRHVHKAGSEELVVFDEGDLFGIISLVSPGKRTASCIGKAPGWLFTMDHRAYRALPPRASIIWKECLAALLGLQLRIANTLVAQFLDGSHSGPIEGDDLRNLVQAAGVLAGSNNAR
jgi:CRP-like cAMP-binding protein